MKLTKRQLQRIIQEELEAALREEEQIVGRPGQKVGHLKGIPAIVGDEDTSAHMGKEKGILGNIPGIVGDLARDLKYGASIRKVDKRQDEKPDIIDDLEAADALKGQETWNEMNKTHPRLAKKYNAAFSRGDYSRAEKFKQMWDRSRVRTPPRGANND